MSDALITPDQLALSWIAQAGVLQICQHAAGVIKRVEW